MEAKGLPTGVYTLRLRAGATTLAKRVVLQWSLAGLTMGQPIFSFTQARVMKYLFLSTVLAVAIVGLTSQAASAQGPGVGGPQPGATTAPIDGGASLLLAAGAAYGLHRLRRLRA